MLFENIYIRLLYLGIMATTLITGGAGFIGSYVAKILIEKGYKVIVYDDFLNYISPTESNYAEALKYRYDNLLKGATIVRGDVRHRATFLRTVQEHQPDSIIHLAALPISTVSNKLSEDAFSINLNGTVNVLETIRDCKAVKRFVLASSSMVYGNFQHEPADETHPTNPIDVYGGTKLSGEIMTQVYSKQYGVEYTIIRPSAVYGPTDANRRVSQIFLENALMGKPLTLHNGGASKLDFTYVKDTAKGIVLALESDKAVNNTFNITRGEGRSLKEFAMILKGLLPNLKIVSEEAPVDEKRPERGALGIEKARRLLHYEPDYPLEKGLKEYFEFVRNIKSCK
jgi:UDP-glucose 4-epimerase